MTDPSRSTPKADVSAPGAPGQAAAEASVDSLRPREAALRQYNIALTNLDLAIQVPPSWPAPPASPDDSQVARLNQAWNILPGGALPLGTGMRARLAGFVWRLIGPALQQQLGFNAALVDHLNRRVRSEAETQKALAETLAGLREGFDGLVRFESLLLQFLQQIIPLADTRERAVEEAIAELRTVTALAQRASAATRQQIERLEAGRSGADLPAATATPAPRPGPAATRDAAGPAAGDAYKYLGFEDQFRGSETEIRGRLQHYVPYFKGASEVLDIGCGRGEFLDLLAASGVNARGLDVNGAMVEVCRARGLEATEADALAYLNALPDESLGGLTAFQVIEHLEPDYLVRLLQAASHKLRPGSSIVLETINPTCWVAFFESYIRDLTHVRPVHPETLKYLLLASDFNGVEIVYRSPVADKLQTVAPGRVHAGVEGAVDSLADLVTTFNRNVERLNARMFTYLDYAAVARRP